MLIAFLLFRYLAYSCSPPSRDRFGGDWMQIRCLNCQWGTCNFINLWQIICPRTKGIAKNYMEIAWKLTQVTLAIMIVIEIDSEEFYIKVCDGENICKSLFNWTTFRVFGLNLHNILCRSSMGSLTNLYTDYDTICRLMLQKAMVTISGYLTGVLPHVQIRFWAEHLDWIVSSICGWFWLLRGFRGILKLSQILEKSKSQ